MPTGNSKKLGRRLGVLAAVVAGCALAYVIDWDFLSSQFTAYRVACEVVVVGDECSQQVIAVNAITYSVGATKGVFFMKPASDHWVEHDIFVSRWKYLAMKSGLWPLW